MASKRRLPGRILPAANARQKMQVGGVADLRPMPSELIDQGPQRSIYRYEMGANVRADVPPILMIPPLAAPTLCFDLRRGCSMAEHFVTTGRRAYLVDYGNIAFSDRSLGIEHWVTDVVPTAIRKVSEDSGGGPVHVVAWCLGGIFSLLTLADQPDLPFASLTSIAAPFDMTAVPLVAPLRPIAKLTDGRIVTSAYRVMGGAPQPLVKKAFQLSSFDKYVTKPLAILQNADDADFLAQIEAVDRFTDNMIAYPGRTFGQMYHRFFRANDLAKGTIDLSGHKIDIANVTVPVLVLAGKDDGIAPVAAVRRLVPLLKGASQVRFEIAPGGHLGVVTGRKARETTWRHIDEFTESIDSDIATSAKTS